MQTVLMCLQSVLMCMVSWDMCLLWCDDFGIHVECIE